MATKEKKKSPKDHKISHETSKMNPKEKLKTETVNEKKDQMIRDVKEAIQSAKEALKEYRQGGSPEQEKEVKGTTADDRLQESDDKSGNKDLQNSSDVDHSSNEIESALSILNDMRVEDSLMTEPGKTADPDQGDIVDPLNLEEERPTMSEIFSGAGSYLFNRSEDVDEYLKNLGVGLVFRKVQSAASPAMTIFPCKHNEWGIKMDSIFRTREIKFRLEEEFTDETYDGRPCRSVATLEPPNLLYIHQRCPTGPDVKVMYETLEDNSVQMTLLSGLNKAVLYFAPNTDI